MRQSTNSLSIKVATRTDHHPQFDGPQHVQENKCQKVTVLLVLPGQLSVPTEMRLELVKLSASV